MLFGLLKGVGMCGENQGFVWGRECILGHFQLTIILHDRLCINGGMLASSKDSKLLLTGTSFRVY